MGGIDCGNGPCRYRNEYEVSERIAEMKSQKGYLITKWGLEKMKQGWTLEEVEEIAEILRTKTINEIKKFILKDEHEVERRKRDDKSFR